MNGTEHYLEAERLTAAYKDAITEIEQQPTDTIEQFEKAVFAARNAHAMLDKAQVHATLALAAATAMAAAELPADGETARQWRQLVSVKRAPIEVPA